MSLYRFKSRETADLVMLEPDGRRILETLGKDLASGIIQANEMAAAASTLHEAAEAEERSQKQQLEEARLNGDPEPTFDSVSFRLRCVPFVEMMQRCEKAEVGIVWGV